MEIFFNYSHRKSLDSNPISYKSYKEYDIDYDFIEEKMTELLLKNKKLLNDNINLFIYNNEVFNNKVTDVITTFESRYSIKNINPDDKVIIYKFWKDNKNINLYKAMINCFIELIKYLNNLRKDNDNNKNNIINENTTKIYEVLDELKDSSFENFKELFKKNDTFTIDKASNIFDYYLKAIFDDVSSEIKDYQQKEVDKNIIQMINDYYKKSHIITKKNLAYAIRLFITLVLFQEDDKDDKIKNNCNNIINYLKSNDFWKKETKDFDEIFLKNLNELKSMNIQINQIISFYEILGRDIEDNFFDDVKQKIEAESQPDPSSNIQNEEENKLEENNGIEENEDEEEQKEENDVEDLY